MEIITKSGAWFYYTLNGHDERWQGKERVKEALAIKKDLAKEIEDMVMARLRGTEAPEGEPTEEPTEEELQDI